MKAFELFKRNPPEYEEAADWFSKAITIAEAHESLVPQRIALYNNRSACRERFGALELSLEDCAVVLAANKTHAKVRRRRARIFEKLGRHADALVEICADLLIQREDFKRSLQQGRTPEQPAPAENVEAVMRAVGKQRADEIIAERKRLGTKFKLPSPNTITQLLMTYVKYSERKSQAEAINVVDLENQVNSIEDDNVVLETLVQMVTVYTYTKRYQEAQAAVERALTLLQKIEASSSSHVSSKCLAEIWRYVGLFRHLTHELSESDEAYRRSLELETDSLLRAETRVKLAGVLVDSGEADKAEAELVQALKEDPESSDVYMHRAQLHVIRRDLQSAQADLEKCIKAAPDHVLARLRLATVLIHNQVDSMEIEEHMLACEKLAPDMSEVYQVKGEIALANNEIETAIQHFDKAIALDSTNPVPLYNKGMALIQLPDGGRDPQRTKDLFEAALKVDPTCMVALMRLSELKLQLAATFDQARDVVDMLDRATVHCRDNDELLELSTVRAMAIAQLEAAQNVGLTSFQM
uniref:Uncharacterized protein n=1 Tax=Aureoumbra lagunensis TaxID=44058 RepID=A0A7S3K1R0_9STRA|mmetsp:Transcript_14892/g.19741  ORF Transcript_14892/g.19741 Transcript_14892/m.19741 type:complete len:526 (-) Transcript_14892:776-2353(-)